MIKETIISIVIIGIIIFFEFYTQNYIEKSVNIMTQLLEELKFEIEQENIDNATAKIEQLEKKWYEIHEKLAYYIEHDELEKVDSAIVQMNSYIKTKEFSLAIAQLEEGKFVLDHIEDKNKLNLQNIF